MANPSPSRVLSGQKEIAAFLGISMRTVQRHWKTMPVLRFEKNIIVLESDLVEWMKKRAQRILQKKNKGLMSSHGVSWRLMSVVIFLSLSNSPFEIWDGNFFEGGSKCKSRKKKVTFS
jgi:hypothetical protein